MEQKQIRNSTETKRRTGKRMNRFDNWYWMCEENENKEKQNVKITSTVFR